MRDEGGAPAVQAPGSADRGSDTGGFGSRGGGFRRSGSPPSGRGQFGNRRGASGFHGLLFFQVNNSALNPKPFWISGLDTPHPAYAQSRFGLVAGGPLVIPEVFQDPATVLSVSYFATRSRKPFSALPPCLPILSARAIFRRGLAGFRSCYPPPFSGERSACQPPGPGGEQEAARVSLRFPTRRGS